ncbi:MAG: fibronectin type III domain-containing protein, partial [Prevotella sp.]|nr:fibronectin type III domain-containing protein [Prevotella sp.]
YMVAPLAPDNFRIEFTKDDEVRLSWEPVEDPQEPTANPSGYIVYTALGDADFDNGTYVRAKNSLELQLEPNLLYHFKVVAANRGGKSFPTEVLSALYNPNARQTVMIVNGFHRVSSPAIRNNGLHQGFDLDEDPGVTYGPTYGWVGRQINFDRTQMGDENGGLGDSSDELAGMLIAGNDFNYVMNHAEAIQMAGNYNIVSCSSQAVETARVQLGKYHVVDLLLGLERNDGHSLDYYKTFDTSLQQALQGYTSRGGRLLVSGAYTGSDMQSEAEQRFLASVLHCQYGGRSLAPTNEVKGLGTNLYFYKNLNEEHYAATSTDILQPVHPAITAMQYADGYGAATAYKGTDGSIFVMGFPFECIKTSQKRGSIMRGILNYLIK